MARTSVFLWDCIGGIHFFKLSHKFPSNLNRFESKRKEKKSLVSPELLPNAMYKSASVDECVKRPLAVSTTTKIMFDFFCFFFLP